MSTISSKAERGETTREELRDTLRFLRRHAVAIFFLAGALVVYQVLRLNVEIGSAEANFNSLIAEYHSEGEASYRTHLTKALRTDRFFIAPQNLTVEVDPRGTVTFSLKYTKRFWILLFPMSRNVMFERETLSTGE